MYVVYPRISMMGFFDLQQTRWLLKTKMGTIISPVVLFLVLSSSSAQQPSSTIAKPNCLDRCGDIEIPYPFGISPDCYRTYSFLVTCDQTFNPPKLFMQNSAVEILNISLDGHLRVLQSIARDCYDKDGTRTTPEYSRTTRISFPLYITVSNTHNKFTIVGCDSHGLVSASGKTNRHIYSGCTARCYDKDDLFEQGSCFGIGCCQTNIPKQIWRATLTLESYNNYTLLKDFQDYYCSHAFIVENTSFSFSPENLTNLESVEKLPMVADWSIGNRTRKCWQEMNTSSYACISRNSSCYEPDNGKGYRCSCTTGYRGNPYLVDGCQDINECEDKNLNMCQEEKFCINTEGDFTCVCPKGHHGDGRKDNQGCIRDHESTIYKLASGIASGVVILLLSACILYLELNRRSLNEKKRKNFIRNGGDLLNELILEKKGSAGYGFKMYSSSELEKATKNFHESRILGKGGSSTVYRGHLKDKTIVAIKKSKQFDEKEAKQFANEVNVLSRIDHKNVVKLLGCCLDTEAPLLVYEFISNGTLSEHIHDQAKASLLDWDVRLRIATETAGVLSYLHSQVSPPILHRDIKTTNILLNDHLTVKVADFGLSRLAPVDQTLVPTAMQGTLGYIDPEYTKTHKLTEKSDVYCFGVVLVELLTGRKAIGKDDNKQDTLDKNLTSFFFDKLEQGCLLEILDGNIFLSEANKVRLTQVAMLAMECLHGEGDNRPSMETVANKLQGIRTTGVQSPAAARTKHNYEEEAESLLGEGSNQGVNIGDGADSSTSNTYDSFTDHAISPLQTGGR